MEILERTFLSTAPWEDLGRVLIAREKRPLAVVDDSLTVLSSNRAMAGLTEWEPEDLVGKPWTALLTEATRIDAVNETLRAAFNFDCWVGEIPARSRRGAPIMLTVEVRTDKQRTHALIFVLRAESGHDSTPRFLGPGHWYEVDLDVNGKGGVLVGAWNEAGAMAGAVGKPCHNFMFGIALPCLHCPAEAVQQTGIEITRVLSHSPDRLYILTARKLEHRIVGCRSVEVGADVYSSLVQGRIDAQAQKAQLSEREKEVLSLLLVGRGIEEISCALAISVSTVKYHQRSMQQKLGAEGRSDLCRLFL